MLPQLRAVYGFVDANVLVRSSEGETKVIVATVWDSIESIKAFAGRELRESVVEPIVSHLLEGFDDDVTHYAAAVAAEDA